VTTEPKCAVAKLELATLEIRVLGTLEVIAPSGNAVAINGQKLRTLLAALALHAGRVISADRLLEALYGEDLPNRADNALQAHISTLRRALRASGVSSPLIRNDGTGYRLEIDPACVDALRFVDLLRSARARMHDRDLVEASQLLHAAIDSWRGHALEALRDCDEVYGARVRLEELRLNAIEDCIECDLAVGQHDRWLDDLEQIVSEHPLRERLWGQLMVLQYRAGRQAEALRSFQRARNHLADQLGITPGPELRRIESAVLAHDPTLSSPVRTDDVAPATTPASFLRSRCRARRQMPTRPNRGCARPDRLGQPDAA
jgi:DNA-binding SARP family transcriptional activator